MIGPWSDTVVDNFVHGFDRSLVGRVIVAEHGSCRLVLQPNLQHLAHILFDGLGVGPAKLKFQFFAPLFLVTRHSALSAQLTVGEVDEKVGSLLHCNMVVDRIVLAILERLKAIDNELIGWRRVLHHLMVEEQAMPAKTSNVAIYRLGRNIQVTCDLPVGHPTGGFHEYLSIKLRELLPV